MIAFRTREPRPPLSFRVKLMLAMMLVVVALAVPTHYFLQHKLAVAFEENASRSFQAELDTLQRLRHMRQEALLERIRALLGKSGVQAVLREDSPDRLYPIAHAELAHLMAGDDTPVESSSSGTVRAFFYRFLDRHGAVIPAPATDAPGALTPQQETALSLPDLSGLPQISYLATPAKGSAAASVVEVLTLPLSTSGGGEPAAALAAGFIPMEFGQFCKKSVLTAGIYFGGRLYLTRLPESDRAALENEIGRAFAQTQGAEHGFSTKIGGVPYRVFHKPLNPGTATAPAYEVSIYSLGLLRGQQQKMRWQILGGSGALLALSLLASHFLAGRLSRPVEKLAEDSAENCALRVRAEAALSVTSEELQRAARFSADASHQLKTPVTVLRAGLEELLAHPAAHTDRSDEIAALIHQTYRLSNVVEDLLLLSRMEAGRLQLEISPVNLTRLVDGWLDDFSALPDPLGLKIESVTPSAIHIQGEKRYTTLILQNLLENARKYNRPAGRIRLSVRSEDDWATLTIGNTGQPIPPEMHQHIFERFHRGTAAENVPGHGLGLNLARELARIHQGDLRLVRSNDDWTEFEVRFRLATAPAKPGASPAQQAS